MSSLDCGVIVWYCDNRCTDNFFWKFLLIFVTFNWAVTFNPVNEFRFPPVISTDCIEIKLNDNEYIQTQWRRHRLWVTCSIDCFIISYVYWNFILSFKIANVVLHALNRVLRRQLKHHTASNYCLLPYIQLSRWRLSDEYDL